MPQRLYDRRCIWCGGRGDYTLLIRKARTPSFRHALRFEVCDQDVAEVFERLWKVAHGDEEEWLLKQLWPRPA